MASISTTSAAISQLATKRDKKPEDDAFIFTTWLRGLYRGNEHSRYADPHLSCERCKGMINFFREIDPDVYFEHYKLVIQKILTFPETKIEVMCLKDDIDVILGYSVYNPTKNIIHWIYVKGGWRKQGIAKSLVPIQPTSVSHLTKAGLSLLRHKHPKAIFNPFLI